MTEQIENIFNNVGGEFITPIEELTKKLGNVKAFLFDWDGVFNAGVKGENVTSTFSEVDSMGLNLLRLSYWLKNGSFPFVGIITGQNNKTAIQFAKREHLNVVYSSFLNKDIALKHINTEYNIKPEEVCFVFDDALDISVAKLAKLRFMVWRNSNPMFEKYVLENGYCDYLTGNSGDQNAVREISELIVSLNGNFNKAINHRVDFDKIYQKYFADRNQIPTSGESGVRSICLRR